MSKKQAAEATTEESVTNRTAKSIEEQAKDNPIQSKSGAASKASPLTADRFGLEVEFNTVFRCSVPNAVAPEDCQKESYWQHVSYQFRKGDTIRVTPDHMEWELILHVHEAGRNYAIVKQKHFWNYGEVPVRAKGPDEYVVQHAGAHHQWRVLLGTRVLKSGFATRELAEKYKKSHQEAVGR